MLAKLADEVPGKICYTLAGGDKNAGQRTKSDEKAHPGNRG